jgi:hypothetical protein
MLRSPPSLRTSVSSRSPAQSPFAISFTTPLSGDGAAVRNTTPPSAVPPVMGQLRTVVDVYLQNLCKDNTKKAYAPKVNEFKGFCDHCYGFLAESMRYTVDPERLYRFLFYHVFREKKEALGRKRGESAAFDPEDYDRVLVTYSGLLSTLSVTVGEGVSTENVPDPQKPLGYDQINTYRSAVKGYWGQQYELNANRLKWDEEINTPSVKKLMSIVKGRKKRVKKQSYAEKVEAEASPFHAYHQIGNVERSYWLQGCSSGSEPAVCPRKTFASLRNRYNFLMNFTAILRNESITIAELSDCRHFDVQRKEDHDPMVVFLLTIGTGKTIKGEAPSQYGRATRHMDVFQCSIGAFGFYLLQRFEVNGEFVEGNLPDFRENSDWFDIKLLCEFGGDAKQEMTQRPFQKSVKDIFASLGIFANHHGHFGRVTGPIYAEFKELPQEMIKILGKWLCFVCFFFILSFTKH